MTATDPQLPAEGYRLAGIAPRAYQHPADKAASAALSAIPQLDRVVRKLIELGYERALRQSALGASVRLGEQQLPEVWAEHVLAYATLDMRRRPPLYMTQFPFANAMAIGVKRPIVVVNSELVRAARRAAAARGVRARGVAHPLRPPAVRHRARDPQRAARSGRLPLPLVPIRTALLEWSRAAELSCDRAAALVTRDPLAVCRTFMSLAGGAMVDQLDLDAFMKQGMEYTEEGTGLERLTRLLTDLGVTHPLPVRRTHELMKLGSRGRLRPHRRRRVRPPRRAGRSALRGRRGGRLLRRALPPRLPRGGRGRRLDGRPARRLAQTRAGGRRVARSRISRERARRPA